MKIHDSAIQSEKDNTIFRSPGKGKGMSFASVSSASDQVELSKSGHEDIKERVPILKRIRKKFIKPYNNKHKLKSIIDTTMKTKDPDMLPLARVADFDDHKHVGKQISEMMTERFLHAFTEPVKGTPVQNSARVSLDIVNLMDKESVQSDHIYKFTQFCRKKMTIEANPFEKRVLEISSPSVSLIGPPWAPVINPGSPVINPNERTEVAREMLKTIRKGPSTFDLTNNSDSEGISLVKSACRAMKYTSYGHISMDLGDEVISTFKKFNSNPVVLRVLDAVEKVVDECIDKDKFVSRIDSQFYAGMIESSLKVSKKDETTALLELTVLALEIKDDTSYGRRYGMKAAKIIIDNIYKTSKDDDNSKLIVTAAKNAILDEGTNYDEKIKIIRSIASGEYNVNDIFRDFKEEWNLSPRTNPSDPSVIRESDRVIIGGVPLSVNRKKGE